MCISTGYLTIIGVLVANMVSNNIKERRKYPDVEILHCDAGLVQSDGWKWINLIFEMLSNFCDAKAILFVCWFIFKKPYIKKVINLSSEDDTLNSKNHYSGLMDDEDDSDIFNKRLYRNTFAEKKGSINLDHGDRFGTDFLDPNYDNHRSIIEEGASFN
jgi:hypothetical protein